MKHPKPQPTDTLPTETGTVAYVNEDRAYGFVSRSNGARDLFFHRRDLREGLQLTKQLRERRVTFEVEEAADGRYIARNVRPAGV